MSRYKHDPLPVVKNRDSHRGYYIVKSLASDVWYISKDSQHIASAPSLEAAKREIDNLLNGGA